MKTKHGVAVIALFIVALGTMGQLSSNAPFFREARIGKAEIDTDGDISTPGAISAASFSAPAARATNVDAGVDDTTQGTVSIFGDNSTGGGILGIYNGASADGTIEYWRWLAHTDGTLKMQRVAPGPTATDWMTVDTSGNVVFPGNGTFTGDLTVTGDVVRGSNANNYVDLDNSGNMLLASRASHQIALDSDNNGTGASWTWYNNGFSTGIARLTEDALFGIGTISPTAALDIEATNSLATNAYVRIRESRGSGNNARLHFGITNNPNDMYIELQRAGVGSWAIGADGSDSDALVFSRSTTLGTNNRLRISTGGDVLVPGVFQHNGNGTLGDASTDLITVTGRLLMRDVNDADMVNVPGTTGEVVRNTADAPDSLWYCTVGDVSNATWAEIDTTGAGGGGNAYWGAATGVGSPGATLSVQDDSVVVFDGLGSINNTITTLSNGVAGQTVTFFNDDDTYDIVLNTGGNILTSTTIAGNNSPSKWATYIYDGTNWRKLANN